MSRQIILRVCNWREWPKVKRTNGSSVNERKRWSDFDDLIGEQVKQNPSEIEWSEEWKKKRSRKNKYQKNNKQIIEKLKQQKPIDNPLCVPLRC